MSKYTNLMKFSKLASRVSGIALIASNRAAAAANAADDQAAAHREAANRKQLYAASDAAKAATLRLEAARKQFVAEQEAIADDHPAFVR